MIINSQRPEFGYELLSAVPFAKWAQEQGILEKTISGTDTAPLYYFSPKHEEEKKDRGWQNMDNLKKEGIPNIAIHGQFYDFSRWANPGWKEHYKNDEYVYDKPICVIANRYNVEWGREPINYFDEDCLNVMFDMLKKKYQIIYIATDLPKKYQDNAKSMTLKDREVCANHPEVIIFQDIVKKSWNTTLLKVFANTERFITMNGGYSILAAYFGGKNIIYTKWCREVSDKNDKGFWKWYPHLGGQDIKVARSYKQLYDTIKWFMVDEIPAMNVLIRTSCRPNYFRECIDSVYRQDYPNVNIIVGCDDKLSYDYVTDEKALFVTLKRQQRDGWSHFPYNLYFNTLQNYVKSGKVMYLDDDDKLETNTAISEIMKYDKELVLWRVKFPGRIIPNDDNFGNIPVYRDISGIGFAVCTDNKKKWSDKKGGDYMLISELYKELSVEWIDKILTGLQHCAGNGNREDINVNYDKMTVPVMYIVKKWKQNDFPKGKLDELDYSTAKALEKKGVVKIINKKLDDMVEVEAIKMNVWGSGKLHQKGERFSISMNKAIRYEKLGDVIILDEKTPIETKEEKYIPEIPEEKVIETKEEKPIETKEEKVEEKPSEKPKKPRAKSKTAVKKTTGKRKTTKKKVKK